MRFAIDVVFVTWPPAPEGACEAVALHEGLAPIRLASVGGKAGRRAAIELPAGGAESAGLAPATIVRLVTS